MRQMAESASCDWCEWLSPARIGIGLLDAAELAAMVVVGVSDLTESDRCFDVTMTGLARSRARWFPSSSFARFAMSATHAMPGKPVKEPFCVWARLPSEDG